jgi:hypothetical protein
MTIEDKSHDLSKGMTLDLAKAFGVKLNTTLKEEQARIVLFLTHYCETLK